MRILFYIPVLLITFLSFSGCEKDDSLDPRPVIVDGQFMRLDIKQDRMDAADLETAFFGGILTSPGQNVVRYELFVRVQRPNAVPLSEYIHLRTITEFPLDLKVTVADIEQAYERASIDIGAVRAGDFIKFNAFSYDSSERKVGYSDLSRTVQAEAAYKQAYRFNTELSTDLTVPEIYNNYQN